MMPRPFRTPARTLSALAAAACLALGLVVPAAADHAGPELVPAAPTEPATTVGTVTLVTGDRVQVTRTAAGKQLATLLSPDDRTPAAVKITEDGDSIFVIPDVARELLDSGALDRELFNVTALLDNGFGTDRQPIPLIVTYDDNPSARTLDRRSGPAHATVGARLESIDAAAVTVSPESATAFWTALADAPTGRLRAAGHVRKIWLDPVITPDLAESVPQIGAPQAWAAGYDGTGTRVAILDTGYDPTHPDLAGKVVTAQDFTGSGSTKDGHGHGTHVASTVAGSGAGSDGKYVGVAPGADLLVGKVMGDDGTGQGSWLIDAMEWAVAQDADVVNMSLSTELSDGTDPISESVNALSATSDTLFVATAGNAGPGEQTVHAPGNADAALSVAAVDKSDVLADFSSRGPRIGDYAIKPEIAAPGVNIVAARAAGTSLGDPVNDLYTAASGTSMAAPHVAGSAAILAQRHPDWGDEELKAALMSTSKMLDGDTVYQIGAGRVDVAQAVQQTVFGAPASISFGRLAFTESTQPTQTRSISYRNDSTEPVRLTLALAVTDSAGRPAPAGMFTLDADHLDVAAGATAAADLRLDPNLGDSKVFGGQLIAADAAGQLRVHTPIGVYKEPEMVEVTVDAVRQDGLQANGASSADLWSLDTDVTYEGRFGGKGGTSGPAVFRVPVGTYSLMGWLWNTDEVGRFGDELAVVTRPEITVSEDLHLVLDGTTAQRIDPITPQPADAHELTVGVYRSAGQHDYSVHWLMDRYVDAVYATETTTPATGEFVVSGHWEMYAPEFAIRDGVSGAPITAEYNEGSPRLDGRHSYQVVDAGVGTPEEIAGLDLAGRMALLRYSESFDLPQAIRNVAAAGASAAVVYLDEPGFFLGWVPDDSPIPSWGVGQQVGTDLLDRLRSGPVTLRIDATAVSPYTYDLFRYWNGHVPATIARAVRAQDLARVDSAYYSSGPGQLGAEARFPMRPYENLAIRQAQTVPMPSSRVEWVTPGEISWQQITFALASQEGTMVESRRSYLPGQSLTADWFRPIARPGVPADVDGFADDGQPPFREGDQFSIWIRSILSADDKYDERVPATTRLFRDGTLVGERASAYGLWPAAATPAHYRLEMDVARSEPWWQQSTATHTAWEFDSGRPAPGQRSPLGLLQVDYDVDTDLRGRLRHPGLARIGLFVHRQAATGGVRGAVVTGWMSVDDGHSWQRIEKIMPHGEGHFVAMIKPPKGSGSVTLRLRVTAPDGQSIDQTVERAFGF